MREMLPTQKISRGIEAPQTMKYTLDKHIDSITFTPWNAKKSITWEQSLWENYTEE